jgi:anti-sigma B factor antagonist
MLLPVVDPAEELLALTITSDAWSAQVTAAGEVDTCSAPRLAAALDTAVAGGAREVTVDLNAVTFLDSAGVHVLATAYSRARASETWLRVLASRRSVLRPLQLSGLWALLGADHGLRLARHPG